MNAKVGFIGLGDIGKWMALSVARAGFKLTVYDIRDEPLRELAASGAKVAASSLQVARASDIIVIMVLDYSQSLDVLRGDNGALRGLGPGKTVVVMSTISPDQAKHLSELVGSTGADFLDSPVSGGYLRAADGKLTLMVGGAIDVLEKCKPVLEAMANRIYHVGCEIGSGETLKLINNMLLGIQEVAASEAVVLGVKAGVDPQLLYDVICDSTGDSWAFRNRMNRVLSRDFSCKAALDILVKDLTLAVSMAADVRMPLMLGPVALQVYQMAMVDGLAKMDDSAVAMAIEKIAGTQIETEAIPNTVAAQSS